MQRLSCLFVLLGAVQAIESGVTPVQKVIQLMTKMVDKGEAEMEAEQDQFKKYEKFCENTTVEKGRRIEEANEKIEGLTASIEKASAEIDELNKDIEHQQSIIDHDSEELANATAVRNEQHADYRQNLKDLEDSDAAMVRALSVLKGAAKSKEQVSLLQTQLSTVLESSHMSPGQATQYLNEFLRGTDDDSAPAPSKQQNLESFLEESEDPLVIGTQPKAKGYSRHSGGVIELMEKLQDEFRAEIGKIKSEEVQRKNAYLGLKVGFDAEIDDATSRKGTATKNMNNLAQEKAADEADLAETKDVLAADSKYKKDLEMDWAKQDADYTSRQTLRGEELEAINKAIEIIGGGSVSGSADKHLPGLLQVDDAVALAQMSSSNLRGHNAAHRAVELLQREAQKLQSNELAGLALRISSGSPAIDKIKTMIKDMVGNIEAKMSEDATKDAWCSEEIAKNKDTRSELSDEVEGLQSVIEKLEANIKSLSHDVKDLTASVTETKAAMSEATELRHEEKANNTATIADAKAAQAAVDQAMKVLEDFYEKAGKATALTQLDSSQVPDSPQALSGGTYNGMGSETGGVLGLIEVIKSDFARLEAETTSEEDTAASEYATFMEDSHLDVTKKDKDIQYKTQTKESTERKVASKKMDLEGVQEELAGAEKTFEELKPQCSQPNPTFEERKAERDAKIKALENALESLRSAEDPAE